MATRLWSCLILLAGLFSGTPARALETDQFYAWGKPIEDSAEYLNAWVHVTIQSALDSRPAHAPEDCESAIHDVQKHLQHSIFQPIELWIFSSDLVDRIPRGGEANRDYRSNYLLSLTFDMDFARLLPPSPTLQVNQIRFGSDKLAHFFSEGWWYYTYWKKHRDRQTPEELERNIFRFGVKLERSIQGTAMSGVFSPADLEANYQGFIFYRQMCHGDEPLLYREGGRWNFSETFDLRHYIYPKWDETWNPNVYSKRRWKGISRTMAGYCPELKSAWVKKQRSYYASLDGPTTTDEQVRELVAENEIADPRTFDITSVCESAENLP